MDDAGKVVFEDLFDASETSTQIVWVFTWLERSTPFRDLASDTVLAWSFAVTFLFSAVAFRAFLRRVMMSMV